MTTPIDVKERRTMDELRPFRHNVELWKETQAHLDEAAVTRSGSAVRLLDAIERILFRHCPVHDPSGECGQACCNCQPGTVR